MIWDVLSGGLQRHVFICLVCQDHVTDRCATSPHYSTAILRHSYLNLKPSTNHHTYHHYRHQRLWSISKTLIRYTVIITMRRVLSSAPRATSLLTSTTSHIRPTSRLPLSSTTSTASRRSYHEKVLDHYSKPRNVGSLPKSDTSVGTGLVGAPACGDVMKLQIRVDPKTERIEEVKFKTFGCGSAIASSSYLTELVRGMTLEDAGKVRNTEIARELCLPPVKCESLLLCSRGSLVEACMEIRC